MALITLLHPSRSRPEKAYRTAYEWMDRAGVEVEHIISVDIDDASIKDYRRKFLINLYQADNSSVVEATNRAVRMAKGDILVYLSDDFKCPINWARSVLKEFEGVTNPMLIKVDDCLQPFHVPVLTIPIMNRALYEKLGYFWHPGYKSMFVDEDLYWTAKKLGALKLCPHLKFEHQHVSVGKAQDDETYRRSAANWDQGKALFAKRKAAGFPL